MYLQMIDQNITTPNHMTGFLTYFATKVFTRSRNSWYFILLGKVNKKITNLGDYLWFPASKLCGLINLDHGKASLHVQIFRGWQAKDSIHGQPWTSEIHQQAVCLIYKEIEFPATYEHSFFSADFRLKKSLNSFRLWDIPYIVRLSILSWLWWRQK